MELSEMIKVMQHYADGGEVEFSDDNFETVMGKANKKDDGGLCWDWDTYTYGIIQPKQKVTIEKWLLYDKNADVYFECRTSNIDKMLQDTPRITKKVKLLESYEVEV